jgi:hypothetical protein
VHLDLFAVVRSLCSSIGVVSATNYLRAESEEDRTDEDREYREELGDDYSEGATSHPFS